MLVDRAARLEAQHRDEEIVLAHEHPAFDADAPVVRQRGPVGPWPGPDLGLHARMLRPRPSETRRQIRRTLRSTEVGRGGRVLILVALLRTRTRAMVGFMATATVVLAAVLLTYPNGGPSWCTPSTAQQATVTTPDQTTGYDSRFEDVGPVTDASAAGPTDC